MFPAELTMRLPKISLISLAALLLWLAPTSAPTQTPAPVERTSPTQTSADAPPIYDKAIFRKPIPPDQLTFLTHYNGLPAGDLLHDKQFKKILHDNVPSSLFHYGHDLSLQEVLDSVLANSSIPITIRDNRYLTLSGPLNTPSGHGFVWIDMQDGLFLGGVVFHPSNGEPSPSLTIFTRQIKQDSITLLMLPPAFATDLASWDMQARVQPVVVRYFVGDIDKKFLLEHDEDFCHYPGSTAASPTGCDQRNADAADNDMIAASYLEQVHYATNATARMINDPAQLTWIETRNSTCGRGPDPLGCRIHLSHERVHTIQHSGGAHRR
jgi:hypothetical protein